MEAFKVIIIAAVLIESIVNTLFKVYDKETKLIDWKLIGSLVVGILVALVFGLDLFAAVGLVVAYTFLWWLPLVFTGILLSRGANVVHDLIATIVNIKDLTNLKARG